MVVYDSIKHLPVLCIFFYHFSYIFWPIFYNCTYIIRLWNLTHLIDAVRQCWDQYVTHSVCLIDYFLIVLISVKYRLLPWLGLFQNKYVIYNTMRKFYMFVNFPNLSWYFLITHLLTIYCNNILVLRINNRCFQKPVISVTWIFAK